MSDETEWRAEQEPEDTPKLAGTWTVFDAIGRVVAFGLTEEMARLIAAAPDIRDALLECESWLAIEFEGLEEGNTHLEVLHQAQAALRKAGAIE